MNEQKLIEMAGEIKNAELREKVIGLLRDPRLTLMELQNSATPPFGKAPASKRRHHSYETGLVVHTYSTTRMALACAEILEGAYGAKIDRDIVIAASLLHDLFKYATYSQLYPGKYGRSRLGERMDHLSLILAELYVRKFPLDVIHAVAAHHGDASPIEPRTLEALVVHLADNLDAEMNDKAFFAAKDILRECIGVEAATLPKEVSPFEVIRTKKEGGCEEVRRRFAPLL